MKRCAHLQPREVHDVITLAEAGAGVFWAGTQSGLWRLHTDTGQFIHAWRADVPLDAASGGTVHRLWRGPAGPLWAATETQLVRQGGEERREFSFPPEGGDLRARCITGDAAGNVWVVRGGKLFRVEVPREGGLSSPPSQTPLTPFPDGFGLADAYVTDVLPDADGRLWVATRFAGLHCLQPAALRLFTAGDGLSRNAVTSVSPARAGGVWVATARGVMRLHEDRFEFPQADVPVRESSGRAVFEDSSGDLWLAQHLMPMPGKGRPADLLWLEPHAGGYRRLVPDKAGVAPSVLHEDRQGRLWIGGRSGLTCLLTNYAAKVSYDDGSGGLVPGANIHRKRATRWLFDGSRPFGKSTSQGWFHVSSNQWQVATNESPVWQPLSSAPLELLADTPILPGERLANLDLRAILHTRDGTLWFGSWGGGLHRLREGRLTVLTTRDGLPADHIHCLHEDADGFLWIGTPAAWPACSHLAAKVTRL